MTFPLACAIFRHELSVSPPLIHTCCVSVGHLSIFFGKMSIHFAYFVIGLFGYFWLLSCINSLYILEINPLSYMCGLQIFSRP